MPEFVHFRGSTKTENYEELLPQLRSLLEGETSLVANLANASSILKTAFESISWVGFYLFEGAELVLGPFQGRPACVRIKPGRGVCGTAFAERRSVIVPDVRAFAGHIVCDPDARSEIVVPLLRDADCYGVLDADSNALASFDATDEKYLISVVQMLLPSFNRGKTNG